MQVQTRKTMVKAGTANQPLLIVLLHKQAFITQESHAFPIAHFVDDAVVGNVCGRLQVVYFPGSIGDACSEIGNNLCLVLEKVVDIGEKAFCLAGEIFEHSQSFGNISQKICPCC